MMPAPILLTLGVLLIAAGTANIVAAMAEAETAGRMSAGERRFFGQQETESAMKSLGYALIGGTCLTLGGGLTFIAIWGIGQ